MNKQQELKANWPILLTCLCGIMLGVGALPTYILGPVAKALQTGLGWQPSDVITTLSFQAAGMALGMPVAGILSDRIHPRPLALCSVLILAVLFLLLPTAASHGLAWFRASYFLMGLLTAGTSGVIYTRVVSGAFNAARGMALGITLAGSGITSFTAPFYVHAMVEAGSWRGVYYGIAILLLLVAVPVLFFGLRHAQRPQPVQSAADHPGASGLPLSAAIRDPRFYLVAATLVSMGMVIGALLVDTVPALVDRGIDALVAARIASLLGLSLIVGRLGCGWLLDRFRPSHVGLAIFLFAAAGSYAFPLGGIVGPLIAVLAIGTINGAEIDLISFMAVRYFGLRHYGRIFGSFYALYMLTSIGGPFFGAWLIRTGGHDMLFMTAAGLFLAGAASLALLSRVEGEPFDNGEEQGTAPAAVAAPGAQGV